MDYKVSFVNQSYRRFYKAHKKEIDKAIQGCLKKGNLIFRGEVEKFEKGFAKFCGKKYCVSLSSGTTALNLVIDYFGGEKWIRQSYFYKIPFLLNKKKVGITEGAMDLKELESKVKSGKTKVLITYMNSVQPDLKEL